MLTSNEHIARTADTMGTLTAQMNGATEQTVMADKTAIDNAKMNGQQTSSNGSPSGNNEEMQYLNMIRDIMDRGQVRVRKFIVVHVRLLIR